ncbi:MAG: triose-phosphate isomerase [Parvularculaceae bacterium]|nr:triose-phosphate isomerase [Parvularculaceae bacterium]
MKPLLAGNWKMNGVSSSVLEVQKLIDQFSGAVPSTLEIVICPPATLVGLFATEFSDEGIGIGAQDCHPQPSGAFTGDISAEMLADAGAAYVIVGHSERRAGHGEDSALIRTKAEAALRAGLTPIVCVGETEAERRAGREKDIVGVQLAESLPAGEGPVVIAYEPVWAIGTGLTPTVDEITEMHAFIRHEAGEGVRILYGGSVKPSNAKEILALPHVDGALVGGASLKADDFAAIIRAAD